MEHFRKYAQPIQDWAHMREIRSGQDSKPLETKADKDEQAREEQPKSHENPEEIEAQEPVEMKTPEPEISKPEPTMLMMVYLYNRKEP
jgi:hypothetical protein